MADELNTEQGGGTYGSTAAAEGWRRSAAARAQFLAPITERMLDLAGIALGSRVLDVASGTGEQTLLAARRIGPNGSVLAPSGGHAPFHVPTDPTIRCRFMLERPSLSSMYGRQVHVVVEGASQRAETPCSSVRIKSQVLYRLS
jgi:hypothetical protein